MFSLSNKPIIKIDRVALSKIFDNESLKKFEELIRVLNNLIPEDLQNIYNYIEESNNQNITIDSKLNSVVNMIKNITVSQPIQDNNDLITVQNRLNAISNIVMMLKVSQEYINKQPNKIKDIKPKLEYIDFNLNPKVAQKQGRISWNSDDITLNLFLNDSVTLQIGQETLFLAKNTSGSTIVDGKLCAFDGTIGSSGKLKVRMGSGIDDPNYLMGISTQTILNNDFGFITHFGLVRGIDTTGTPYGEIWSDGDLLYPNPSINGRLTNIQPQAPRFRSPIATVINASSSGSGSIFVRMKTGEKISTLHDVNISSLANNDILRYNSLLNRWENKPLLTTGASGFFVSADGKTVTVQNGLITSIN